VKTFYGIWFYVSNFSSTIYRTEAETSEEAIQKFKDASYGDDKVRWVIWSSGEEPFDNREESSIRDIR